MCYASEDSKDKIKEYIVLSLSSKYVYNSFSCPKRNFMGIGKKMFILLSFSSSSYQPQKMLHIVRTKKNIAFAKWNKK